MSKTSKTLLLITLAALSGCASITGKLPADPDTPTTISSENRPALDYSVYKSKTELPSPTIIVAHGCNGLPRNQAMLDKASHYSKLGYNVILLDSFSGRGIDRTCGNGRLVMPEWRADDLARAAAYAKSQPWHRGGIAVIGYSHGGGAVMNLIVNPIASKNISAAIAYYPSCDRRFIGRDYSKPLIPVMLHVGDADNWTPYQNCTNMDKFNFYVYPGATHGYDIGGPPITVLGKYQIVYDSQATELSYKRDAEFLKKYLGSTDFNR